MKILKNKVHLVFYLRRYLFSLFAFNLFVNVGLAFGDVLFLPDDGESHIPLYFKAQNFAVSEERVVKEDLNGKDFLADMENYDGHILCANIGLDAADIAFKALMDGFYPIGGPLALIDLLLSPKVYKVKLMHFAMCRADGNWEDRVPKEGNKIFKPFKWEEYWTKEPPDLESLPPLFPPPPNPDEPTPSPTPTASPSPSPADEIKALCKDKAKINKIKQDFIDLLTNTVNELKALLSQLKSSGFVDRFLKDTGATCGGIKNAKQFSKNCGDIFKIATQLNKDFLEFKSSDRCQSVMSFFDLFNNSCLSNNLLQNLACDLSDTTKEAEQLLSIADALLKDLNINNLCDKVFDPAFISFVDKLSLNGNHFSDLASKCTREEPRKILLLLNSFLGDSAGEKLRDCISKIKDANLFVLDLSFSRDLPPFDPDESKKNNQEKLQMLKEKLEVTAKVANDTLDELLNNISSFIANFEEDLKIENKFKQECKDLSNLTPENILSGPFGLLLNMQLMCDTCKKVDNGEEPYAPPKED